MPDTADTVTAAPGCSHPRFAAGCRSCQQASASAARRRTRLLAYGRWDPWTDAAPVREHVQGLRDDGLSPRRIAAAAGVSVNAVRYLLGIERGKPATRRLRPATAAALLAVTLTPELHRRPSLTDATGTVRRLQALIAAGHCRGELAGRLGMHIDSLCRLLRIADQVRVTTAASVAALYDELWDALPDESAPLPARRAARARSEGLAAGWPLPAAWDDDAIDDPAAAPAEGWRRGLQGTSAGLAEDALELMARGLDRNQVAERLKVKRDTLDAALARTARRTAQETTRTDPAEERSHAAA